MKIKNLLKKTALLCAALLFLGTAVMPRIAAAAVTSQAIAVPMYQYPTIGTFWSDITGGGSARVPFIIADPASGPGASADPNYTTAINNAVAAGIRVIGYVNTSYQTVNYQTALNDVNTWYQLYPNISGIFIDQVADGTGANQCYIASLYNHVKNQHANDLVVLNPGTNISANYEPYGDIFANAENTFAAYQASWSVQYPGFEDNPAFQNRFWHIIHTATSGQYAAALSLAQSRNAGWVYITDDVMPNPYDVTPSYWNTELSDVGTLPASTIPNRGKTQLPSGCQDLTASTTNTNTTSSQKVKSASSITVANSSAFTVEPTTRIAFTLPAGVTLAGSGTNWTCDASSCSYSAAVPATGNAAVLAAEFTAGCGYSSGIVSGVLSNFAGNTSSFTVTPTRPSDCAALANTGLSTGITSAIGAVLVAAAFGVRFSRTRLHYMHRLRK
jgi:hypothetical protein